jgi:opacity protein-like surface antigen
MRRTRLASTTAAALVLGLASALGAGATAVSAQTLADYDYENLTFRGVGLDWGYIWPDKVRPTQLYSVRLDLGYLGPGIRIIPSISYWTSEFTGEELDILAGRLRDATGAEITGEDLGPIRWSDISLSADAHFVWNTPIHILTYVGAGVGLHAMNGQGDAIQATFVEDLLDSIAASFAPLAGLEFGLIPRFRVYAEGRYNIMNAIQYLSARGGLQFMFGQDTGVQVGLAVPAPPPPLETP